MNRNYNPLEDLANSGNRLIGKGVCVDCHKFSGKYKRCFQCNKSNQRYYNEKKEREEKYLKASRVFMIARGKECKTNGGENCTHIVCPNCSPIETFDEKTEMFVKKNLDYLLKEQDEEDLKELEMLEKEFERAIK